MLNLIRIFIAYLLLSRGGRFLKSNFLLDLPASFYNVSGHLVPISLHPLAKVFPIIFALWIAFGIGTIVFFERVWVRWTFFLLSLVFLALPNQIVLPLRIDNMALIFLFLITLLNPKAESFEDLQKNAILIFFGRIFWVLFYFGAGVHKILYTGWSWTDAENLRAHIVLRTQYGHCQSESLWIIPQFFINHPELIKIISVCALGFELFYPIIFLKRLRIPMLLATVVFHIGIYILLGTNFIFHLGGMVFWFMAIDEHWLRRGTDTTA